MSGAYSQLGGTLWRIARARLRPPDPHSVPDHDGQFVPVSPPPLLPALPGRGTVAHRAVNRLDRQRYAARRPAAYAGVSEVRRVDGTLIDVIVDSSITTREAAEANRSLVVDVCEKLDLDYFVVPDSIGRRTRLGVSSTGWEQLLTALIELAQTQPIYVQIRTQTPEGQVERTSHLLSHPEIQQAARTQNRLRFFRQYARSAKGGAILAELPACLVERWDEDPETGGLTAPYHNRRTAYVSGSYRDPVRQQRNGTPERTLAAFAAPDVFDLTFPIDVVYTWVDGSDPAWQERKRVALAARGIESHPGTADRRFNDNGELRYSLRSIDQFAPWVRHIYLVTDQQRPSWLDPDQTRVTLVDHRDILPADALPTFNSHSIEARLHHIDGLSEQFLYFNDDFFLGRPVHPALFFDSNGTAKFFLSLRNSLAYQGLGEGAPHERARRNTVELLERDFGVTAGRLFRHTPIAQRRSLLFELEDRYAAEFEQTWRSAFRSPKDFQINSWLHHYYGYLTKKTRPAEIRYAYFDPAQPRYWDAMKGAIRTRGLDAFCINEAEEERQADRHQEIADWLQRYFPVPSSAERT